METIIFGQCRVSRMQKVHIFSDSVLCLGKVNQNPKSSTAWEGQVGLVRRFSTIQNFGHN